DFETVEAFGKALKAFNGTVFFISHDRTFVNMLATRIVEVKDGTVLYYPGNYEEYVYSMETKVREKLRGDTNVRSKSKSDSKARPAADKRSDRNLIKQLKAERMKFNSQARDVHIRIERHQTECEAIRHVFTTDSSSWSRESNARYEYLEKDIKDDEEVWLSLMEKAEELTRKIGSIS
ncbi:MAG: hypothetical protein P9L93_04755, partial [Candidatus Gorgyraea atricola]|nr:hypothetical protein [Candidatus Gorgyraea atricola]